jgi:hypothetical protein
MISRGLRFTSIRIITIVLMMVMIGQRFDQNAIQTVIARF